MALANPQEEFKVLVSAIVVLALLGVLLITLVSVAWRRFNQRQSRMGRHAPEPPTDAWRIAGQRMATPPPEPPESPEESGDPDSDSPEFPEDKEPEP